MTEEQENEGINQIYDYFIEEDSNIDGIFNIINEMPDNELDLETEYTDLPEVINNVVYDAVLSQEGLIKFM